MLEPRTGGFEKVLAPWHCTVSLLGVVLLATGCATAGVARGDWPGSGLPPDVDEEVLEESAEAEAARAVAEVWAAASGIQEVGARLSFTFWSERGALTLTGYLATGRSGHLGGKVDEQATLHTLTTTLRSFAQQRTGMSQVTLVREERQWRVGYTQLQQPRPPEAKTLPVRRTGLPATMTRSATEGFRRLLKAVNVPGGKEASVDVAVHLEDGRIEAWELQLFELTSRSAAVGPQKPEPVVSDEAAAVVLPFTQGLGERTVHLRLKLARSPDSRWTGGWVQEARVLRLPPPRADAGFATEYRMMHEDILRRWREETQEGFAWVAREGAEELALWYVGGIVTKGVGWLGARTLPAVMTALRPRKT